MSLLPWQRREVVGGGREEVWPDLHTFLSAGAGACVHVRTRGRPTDCRNAADVECHAVLLCSLLLGFGLDAYVCVGCLAVEGEGAGVRGGPLDVIGGPTSRDHVWVMTRSTEGACWLALCDSAAVRHCMARAAPAGNVTFWEPLTGQRHPLGALCPYERVRAVPQRPRLCAPLTPACPQIGCVFNHRRFLANVQGSEAVADCDFALEDGALWKAVRCRCFRCPHRAASQCCAACRPRCWRGRWMRICSQCFLISGVRAPPRASRCARRPRRA